MHGKDLGGPFWVTATSLSVKLRNQQQNRKRLRQQNSLETGETDCSTLSISISACSSLMQLPTNIKVRRQPLYTLSLTVISGD